jgi:uncharacterized protein
MITNNNSNDKKAALDFPCRFPIKIVGVNDSAIVAVVVAIIKQHDEQFGDTDISYRLSSRGNYLAITASIHAQSQQQLDAIYRTLSQHQLIKVVL